MIDRSGPTDLFPKPSRSVLIGPDCFAHEAIERTADWPPITIFPTCVSGDANAHSKYLWRVVSEVKTDAARKIEF